MHPIRLSLTTLGMTLMSLAACANSAATCPPAAGVALQVLGSGGPIADDGRASSSYIVWINGQSRVLIDAGSGSFLRFGEVGASFASLDFIGLSHFHTDHSADLPALLKTGYFSDRSRALNIAGPSGDSRFPGLNTFLAAILDETKGAYAYLGGYLTGSDGLVEIIPRETSIDNASPVVVYQNDVGDLTVEALPVPHGIVPTIAFRVSIGNESIVFASDQNGSKEQLAQFAEDASVFVVHMPIPENATAGARSLHATPSRLAELAAVAKPDVLVVSHLMQRSLRNPDQGIDVIRTAYSGRIIVAEDKACVLISAD